MGQKNLNRTLAIDLHFQTFTIGFLVEVIDYSSTTALSRNSSKSRIFLYLAHLALFVRMDDTIIGTNEVVSIVI